MQGQCRRGLCVCKLQYNSFPIPLASDGRAGQKRDNSSLCLTLKLHQSARGKSGFNLCFHFWCTARSVRRRRWTRCNYRYASTIPLLHFNCHTNTYLNTSTETNINTETNANTNTDTAPQTHPPPPFQLPYKHRYKYHYRYNYKCKYKYKPTALLHFNCHSFIFRLHNQVTSNNAEIWHQMFLISCNYHQ